MRKKENGYLQVKDSEDNSDTSVSIPQLKRQEYKHTVCASSHL